MGAGALSGGLPERAFSPEEAAALRQKLWPLLARQAGLYTGCGSSSLPEDTARELLCSLCYTLKVWFQAGGAASQPLADADLEAGLRQGQAILEQKCRQARRLWMAVRHSAPDLKNRALADTLDSIGAFFQRYDLRFFDHCIPCDIDYPLCRAVPETLPGVDYILAYLDRLGMEHALLRPFAPSRVRRLLAAGCPDPVGLLVNLCEPVLANAVGLTLLGEDPRELEITPQRRTRLCEYFEPLPPHRARAALRDGAARLCAGLGLPTPAADYFMDTAQALHPRIKAALPNRLNGVFLSLAP